MARSIDFILTAKDEASKVFDKASGSAEKAGSKFGAFAKGLGGLAAGAGLVAGAALAKGISDAIDATDLNARFKVKLGATSEEAKKAGKVAGDVYRGAFGESLPQVQEAVTLVYRNIGKGTDEWAQSTTEKVLTVADVFEQDLGATTRAVGQLIRTGLATDANQALDIITRGFQVGGDKAEDFLDTLNEYGTQFRKVGLSGEQATGLISQGLQAGARDADKVADAIKEFSIRAIDGSKLTAEGFSSIGLNAGKMATEIGAGGERANAALDLTLDTLRGIEDPVKRNAAAVALFGTQAEDLGDALYALDPSQAVAALGDVAGAADNAVKTMGETPAAKIEAFKRTVSTGLTTLGGSIIGFVQSAIPEIGKFGAQWGVTSDSVKAAGKKILDAIVPVIRDQVIPAFKAFVEAIKPVLIFLKNVLGPVVKAVFSAMISNIQAAFKIIAGIFNVIAALLTGDWRRLWDGIKQIVSGAFQILRNLFSVGVAALKAVFSLAVGALRAIAVRIGQGIVSAIRGFIGQMGSIGRAIINGLINGIRGAAGAVWNAVQSVVSRIPSGIKKFLGIGSPSKVTRVFGQQIMEGLALGMEDGRREVETAFAGTTFRADLGAYNSRARAATPEPVVVNVYAQAVGSEAQLARTIRSALGTARGRGQLLTT